MSGLKKTRLLLRIKQLKLNCTALWKLAGEAHLYSHTKDAIQVMGVRSRWRRHLEYVEGRWSIKKPGAADQPATSGLIFKEGSI